MKLSPVYSRIAVRPFPSSPWVFEVLQDLREKLFGAFIKIDEGLSGPIDYRRVSIFGGKNPIWTGRIPSGEANGLKLSIYLLPKPGSFTCSGNLTITRDFIPELKVKIYFGAPIEADEVEYFMFEEDGIEEILTAVHHELIHVEDPKNWNLYRNPSQYINPSGGKDDSRYYKQPVEVSAFEGMSYSYFKSAFISRVPMRKAIERYINEFSDQGYIESIKTDPKRWRQFLERTYKSAEQAYREN